MSRILGVDYGSTRVGLALSDPMGVLASPLAVVPRSEVVGYVQKVSKEHSLGKIIVGLPTALGGSEGSSAQEARALGQELAENTGVEVIFSDERFTSRIAESTLLEAGMRRRDRRQTVDKIAATIILQDYLDKQ